MKDLIQFGTKRGQPDQYLLDDVGHVNALHDIGYIPYIREQWPNLYDKLVTRHGQRIIDRSTHNQMQRDFIYPAYRRAFCRIAKPGWEKTLWAEFVAEVSLAASRASAPLAEELNKLPALCWMGCYSTCSIEKKGVDVRMTMELEISRPKQSLNIPYGDWPRALRCPGEKDTLNVEIKPGIWNNFSDVARQMDNLNEKYLFLHRYEGTDIPEHEFVELFRQSGIVVVFKNDVDEEYVRLVSAGECSATIH